MKKKKLKKLLKQAQNKLARIKPSRKPKQQAVKPGPEVLALMQKVKQQLDDLERPVEAQRKEFESWNPTVADYAAMDPYYMSTMQVIRAGETAHNLGPKNSC